jgi:diguanylate cyclase (GGDEF)-like protein
MALEQRGKGIARTEAYLSTRRAALLVGTALLVPITLIFQQFRDLSIDMLVFATGAAVLFGLVVSRMHLIVRSLETAIDTQTELQQSLEFAAYHDPLTGLANRALLNASLGTMVEHHREKSIALLFLDLDNFKDVNDRLGHAVGDNLLIQVAEQLGACIRPQDLIGRIGGDEFVILLRFDGEPPLDTSIAVSERILKVLEDFTEIDGEPIQIGASIGIAWLGNDHVSVDSILRAADHAMYDAKRAGKNRYSVTTVIPDGEPMSMADDRRRPTALRPMDPHGPKPAKISFSA